MIRPRPARRPLPTSWSTVHAIVAARRCPRFLVDACLLDPPSELITATSRYVPGECAKWFGHQGRHG